MSTENQPSNPVLINTIVDTIDQHGKQIDKQEGRIQAVEKKVNSSLEVLAQINKIYTSVTELSTALRNSVWPADKVQELVVLLKSAIPLLQQPVTTQVQHHHHIPKLLWLSAGLFLVVCFLSLGWVNTAGKLSDFKANDTKYRKIRLMADSAFLIYLDRLDSLYQAGPDQLRNNVIEQEQLKEQRLELLDKIQQVNSRIDDPTGKAGSKSATTDRK